MSDFWKDTVDDLWVDTVDDIFVDVTSAAPTTVVVTTLAPTTIATTAGPTTIGPTTLPPTTLSPTTYSPEPGWVADYKGLGPWDFIEQKDKWGYLNNPRWTIDRENPVNYSGREGEEPQVWDDNQVDKDVGGVDIGHFPCGHWHKREFGPVVGIYSFEAIYEFLTTTMAMPEMDAGTDEIIGLDLNIKIPPNGGTYTFEVIARSNLIFDTVLTVIDTDDKVCSTITIPAGSFGATEYELYRFTSIFTEGNGEYLLKLSKPPSASWISSISKFTISTARIKLFREDATDARIQILLLGGGYNYCFLEDSDYPPYSKPRGYFMYDSGGSTYLDNFTSVWTGSSGDNITSIWKYDSDEISTITQVIFSVAVTPQKLASSSTSTVYTVTTFDRTGMDWMLYWAPNGTAASAASSGDFWTSEYATHIDIHGTLFTPIPGSYIREITGQSSGSNVVFNPDFSSVPKDAEICFGGCIYGFAGSVYGDAVAWGHYGSFLTLSVGVLNSFYGQSVTNNYTDIRHFNSVLEYTVQANTISNTEVALWNLTSDIIVANSTLVWEPYTGFARKEAIINLVSGCEYEVRVKCPGQVITVPGHDPQLHDAQLLIDIDPIDNLTFYNRIARAYDGYWDNWIMPYAWGGNCYSTPSYEGSMSLGERILINPVAFLSIESIQFEATGYVGTTGLTTTCYDLLVEDYSINDSAGSGTTGSDVVGSTLSWTAITRERKRSNALTLVNNHIYGHRLPAGDTLFLVTNNGFLVCKYNSV